MHRYSDICNNCKREGFPCSQACLNWDVEVTIAADTGYWPGTRRPYTYDWELALSDSDPESDYDDYDDYYYHEQEHLRMEDVYGADELEERDACRCAAVEKSKRRKASLGLTAQRAAARLRQRKAREERKMQRNQGIKATAVAFSAPVSTTKSSDTPKSRKAAGRTGRKERHRGRAGRSGRTRRR